MGVVSKLLGAISGGSKLDVSEQLLYDKVIGFRGIVPGVGTSTIVHNVAEALSDTTSYNICVLDLAFMYPSQYSYFIQSNYLVEHKRDFLDYDGEIDMVVFPTSLRNVHLVALKNRGIVDMLSSKDSEDSIVSIIGTLKSYFDVILVDIPNEYTYITTYGSIKCNRIINVADPSAKCMTYLKKSLNTLATLGVSFAKADRVILNKVPKGLELNTDKVFSALDLNVIGAIPLSTEIAMRGVSNKKVWGMASNSEDIERFIEVINNVVLAVVQKTPLTSKCYTKSLNINDASKTDDSTTDDSTPASIPDDSTSGYMAVKSTDGTPSPDYSSIAVSTTKKDAVVYSSDNKHTTIGFSSSMADDIDDSGDSDDMEVID